MPNETCPDCKSRRGIFTRFLQMFAGTAIGGSLLVKHLMPEDGYWKKASTKEKIDWFEDRANDPNYLGSVTPELRKAILNRDLNAITDMEIYVGPTNAAEGADYCYVTQQFCVWCPYAPNPRRCQRDYRCWSSSGGYWYNTSIQMGCPSCPCPKIT